MYYNIKINGKTEFAQTKAMIFAMLKELTDEHTAKIVYNNIDNLYSFYINGKVCYIRPSIVTVYTLYENTLGNPIASFTDKHSATIAKLDYEHLDYEAGVKPNYQIQKIELICPNER